MLERGANRLEIARRLLKLPQDECVLSHIMAMPKNEQEHLRGLVDWVEEYEKHEQAMGTRLP